MSKTGNIHGGSRPPKRPAGKPLKKNGGGFLPRAKYTSENAKPYMLATILVFHVMPLLLMLCGDTGKSLLNSSVRIYINPMVVVAILLVYGIRVGFNFKLPILVTLLSAVSTIMYYKIGIDKEMGMFYYYFLNFATYLCIYAVMAFLGAFCGALINKLKVF